MPRLWIQQSRNDRKTRMGKMSYMNTNVRLKNNYVSRRDVYDIIDGERDYQDKKWSGDIHSVGDWIVFMRTYLTQAETRFSKEVGDSGALDEIRKVAALAVACMEQNGYVERNGFTS
jgi:hypothetical protein